MSSPIRQMGTNTSLAAGIISTMISLPLGFGEIRALVAEANPAWLLRWKQVVYLGWAVTLSIAGATLLWETRRFWAPSVGRGLLTVLGCLWRLFGALPGLSSKGRNQAEGLPFGTETSPKGNEKIFYPPLNLLGPPVSIEVQPCPDVAEKVKSALKALGAPGCEIVRHYAGPVVNVVQIQCPELVKASTVISVANDLAAFLGARSVNISPVVGAPGVLQVELAGKETAKVSLRTLLETGALRRAGCLPIAVAIDTRGKPLVCDLAALPHLLIAGATGTGKSTVLRVLIVCLLYQFRPEELQLLIIDPKPDGALFNGLPHLRQPVVPTAQAALHVLSGLVQEMRQRYALFESSEVTNLETLNRKFPTKRLPYVVCVIDELASLMGSHAKKETEAAIQALAQESRAAGIHLIVATQRPSVDVVTGIVKANLPARLSLRLGSMADSRTILDSGGAEYLRGKGDLYFRPEGEMERGQGAVVSEEAVRAVVNWWRDQEPPQLPPPIEPAAPILATSHVSKAEPVSLGLEPGYSEVTEVPQHPVPHDREAQELRWVKERALEHGCISRRIVEKGLGIRTERAAALVRVLEEEGWIQVLRTPQPRRLTFSADERRLRLAQLRGVRPEEIRLDESSEGSDTTEESNSPGTYPLHATAGHIDEEVSVALESSPADFRVLQGLLVRLDGLIDMALDQSDPAAFDVLTNTWRRINERLTDR